MTEVHHASVTGASTLRVGRRATTDADLRRELRLDYARLPTVDQGFLTNYYRGEERVGTKIARLLQEINSMIHKDSASKCVVFSQYQGVLDVAAEELLGRGVGLARLDGLSKQHERADALMEFQSNPTVKVFLLSMRAGAVGLNLTCADHCFIMDIAQNPSIEEQSIDRIHRM